MQLTNHPMPPSLQIMEILRQRMITRRDVLEEEQQEDFEDMEEWG
jgi:hypothetical protein